MSANIINSHTMKGQMIKANANEISGKNTANKKNMEKLTEIKQLS